MIANSPAAWSDRARAGASHEAALWSERGQRSRFVSVLGALAPRAGESLLDYGCGTGALADLLPAGMRYAGYDWAPGMVERARTDHPGDRFSLREPYEVFDLVACIGPFNLPDGWWKTRTWATLERLWGQTRRALAVCLYAGDDTDCLIYTEDEAEAFARELAAPRFTVTRHRPNDILLLLERH